MQHKTTNNKTNTTMEKEKRFAIVVMTPSLMFTLCKDGKCHELFHTAKLYQRKSMAIKAAKTWASTRSDTKSFVLSLSLTECERVIEELGFIYDYIDSEHIVYKSQDEQ